MASQFRVRHVRPADAPALGAFYAELSAESRRRRFFGACCGISAAQARRFAQARRRGGDGLVAVTRGGRFIGHMAMEPVGMLDGRPIEEVGVAVADDWQEHGVGRAMLSQGVAAARERGVATLEAEMLTGNPGIHALLQHAGVPWTIRAMEPGSEVLQMELGAAPLSVAAA